MINKQVKPNPNTNPNPKPLKPSSWTMFAKREGYPSKKVTLALTHFFFF